MSRHYFDVLKKVKEINKELKSEEKKEFPEIVRSRRYFLLSAILVCLSYFLLTVVPMFVNIDVKYFWIFLLQLLFFIVIFIISIINYGKKTEKFPNVFLKKSKKLSEYIETKFSVNSLAAIDSLIDECKRYNEERGRKFSIISKVFSITMSAAIIPTLNLVLKGLFNNSDGKNIFHVNVNAFGTILIIVIILTTCLLGFWEEILNNPLFGQGAKNISLYELLVEVRYLIYSKKVTYKDVSKRKYKHCHFR
ncbi:hypothetical protein ACVRXF_06730 [Streptococcus orisasini]